MGNESNLYMGPYITVVTDYHESDGWVRSVFDLVTSEMVDKLVNLTPAYYDKPNNPKTPGYKLFMLGSLDSYEDQFIYDRDSYNEPALGLPTYEAQNEAMFKLKDELSEVIEFLYEQPRVEIVKLEYGILQESER